MRPTIARPAFYCLLLSTLATETGARAASHPPLPAGTPAAATRSLDALLALESVRARRLVQREMRLRLLQLREHDLDRVRLVVERKLRLERLLDGETPPPGGRIPP